MPSFSSIPYSPIPMISRFLSIGTVMLTLLAAFTFVLPSAEANYYYDEAYYNHQGSCPQNRNANTRCRNTTNRNTMYVRNPYSYNSSFYNGSAYRNQYPYGAVNYGRDGYYRPVDNYYNSSQNNGCYWYYGSYRCDNNCNR